MREIHLSERALLKAVVVAFGLFILIRLLERATWVLVVILLALILASAIMPAVNAAQRLRLPPNGWQLPKALVVILIYLVVASLVLTLGYLVGRAIVGQLLGFIADLPSLAGNVSRMFRSLTESLGVEGLAPSPEEVTSQVQQIAGNLAAFASTFVSSFANFVFQLFMVLILALFLVVEAERTHAFVVNLFPPQQRSKAREVTARMGKKIGFWLIGQLFVAATVGTAAGLAMLLLGMPYPLVVGLATAVLDLAPAVGPSVMIVPVFLLGLTESPTLALLAAAIFLALSELDAHVLTPLITGRVVNLSRVLILGAVLFGLALYGPIGALMAVPVATSLQVFVQEVALPWLRRQQGQGEDEARADPARQPSDENKRETE